MNQEVFKAPSVFNLSAHCQVPGETSVLGPQFAIFSSLTSCGVTTSSTG